MKRILTFLAGLVLLAPPLFASGYSTQGAVATSVPNAATFNNGGSGAASGTTFNGSSAVTVSTNTLGALNASNNLSDVASATTSRTNLGLGTAATQSAGTFLQTANNLSDITDTNASAKNLQGGYVVCQSAASAAVTGTTSETTLATCTVPAAALGANGRVEVEAMFSHTSSANTKTEKIKFGGTAFGTVAPTATAGLRMATALADRNATGSQVGNSTYFPYGGTVSVGSLVTSSVDTTASQSILITGTLANSGETITLEAYRVLIYPKT